MFAACERHFIKLVFYTVKHYSVIEAVVAYFNK